MTARQIGSTSTNTLRSPYVPNAPRRRSDSGCGADNASFQRVLKLAAELAVAIMPQVATTLQIPRIFHGGVSGHLLHPFSVRVMCDAAQTDPPASDLNEKQQ